MLEVRNISVNLGIADGKTFFDWLPARMSRSSAQMAVENPRCYGRWLDRCPRKQENVFGGQKFTQFRNRACESSWPLSQQESVPSMTTVFDYVYAGRHPYNFFRGLTQADIELVNQNLIDFEVDHLRHNLVERLSGGERQRVRLATLMARSPSRFLR